MKNKLIPLSNIFRNLLKQNKLRKAILILLDSSLISFSIWLSLNYFHGIEKSSTLKSYLWIYIAALAISIPLYKFTNHYKTLTRFTGSRNIYFLFLRNLILFFLVFSTGIIIGFPIPLFNNWVLIFIFSSGFISLTRFFLRDFLLLVLKPNISNRSIVVIYGAGNAGNQLAKNLLNDNTHVIKCFVDDNVDLSNRTLHGISIYQPNYIKSIINEIDKIFIAIPSASNNDIKKIINSLSEYDIPIFLVPSIKEFYSNSNTLNCLRKVSIEDLLARDKVYPKEELLSLAIRDKIIFISGSGGSIGSELCKKILEFSPKKLICLDNCEENLYKIEQSFQEEKCEFILGNAKDFILLEKVFKNNKINIVFHAAAYKHVPIVENNPVEGIYNNTLTTKVLCELSEKFKIEKFVLISSDKAVRPTNVMGATKRLSEIIVQSFAQKQKDYKKTIFLMVRFGNVLNSSGSVVPKFKDQILRGGPVTITHPEITRFFMTISEAAELVIQSSGLAKGGEVFILDMGKSVKILDMAKQMIKLAGYKIKDSNNPYGDIEIIYTGLRPGEKLYEELLINAESQKTSHPLIYKANEKYIEEKKVIELLEKLYMALEKKDKSECLKALSYLVPEWNPSLSIN
tara:strand:+ start:197 stop:2077 length:1881 start_codon:yes stop_codon:yes gene_type:complete